MQRAVKDRIKAALSDVDLYTRSARTAVQASDGEAFAAYIHGAEYALARAVVLWTGALEPEVVDLVERLGSEDDVERVTAAEALEDWVREMVGDGRGTIP